MNRTTLKLLLPLTVMSFLISLKMFIIIAAEIRQEGFQLLNAEPTQLKYWSPKAVPRSSIPILPFPISSIARPQNFADAAFEKTYCEQFQASSDFQSKNLIAMPGKLAFKKP